MVIVTQVFISTSPGGSGSVEFLKIAPLVQEILGLEVKQAFAKQFAHWKFVCCRRTTLVGCKYFHKNLFYGPGAGVMAQLTPPPHPPVMIIHLKTPLGALGTLKYP